MATPLALVVLCEGLTEPSDPPTGAQLTTTPGTTQLFASHAVTLYGAGKALLKYQSCWSPPLFTNWVATPGVHGPVPPPPPPPHATKMPRPTMHSRSQRRTVIARLLLK